VKIFILNTKILNACDYFIYLFIFKFGNLLIINKLTYRLGRAFLLTTTWLAISTKFDILISVFSTI